MMKLRPLIPRYFSTRYTKTHAWFKHLGNRNEYLVGMSKHAVDSLGDVAFIEVESRPKPLAKDDLLATVESAKASTSVYMPFKGQVEVNAQLQDRPGLLNQDPEGQGWLARVVVGDTRKDIEQGSMSQEEYVEYCKE